MPTQTTNTDYLRFDPQSMKELITLKLSENSTFTDQIYEGSNLSVFIDIFAAMYGCLTYQLNLNAAESIFTDTQFYDSMNRLVKLIGYNPAGFISSSVLTNINVKPNELLLDSILTIPKYTTINTGLYTSDGSTIKFTFTENFTFIVENNLIDADFSPLLTNGEWVYYVNNFRSNGEPFEMFTLTEISDSTYISHPFIDVYIETDIGEFIYYSPMTDLSNSSFNDTHYELRLNENKQYTLKFGDGVTGKRIPKNSKLHIIYLHSNGPDGRLPLNYLHKDLNFNVSIVGLSEVFIKNNILKIDENPGFITFGSTPTNQLDRIYLTNPSESSEPKDAESVEEIRQNAPFSARRGNRVITEQDFKQYILNNYPSEVYDVEVMNNYEYLSTFIAWLKSYDNLTLDIRSFDYKFADACDFNNVYLWCKSFLNSPLTSLTKRKLEIDINRLKPLTSELIFPDPLAVLFSPYINGVYNWTEFDLTHENKIIIERDKNSMITVEKIQQQVITTIQSFFNILNIKIGMTVNITTLYNNLMSIPGVSRIKTRYLANGDTIENAEYFNGLSFAKWTPLLIEGKDFTIITGPYKLAKFQYPILLDSEHILNKIEVTSEPYVVGQIEY